MLTGGSLPPSTRKLVGWGDKYEARYEIRKRRKENAYYRAGKSYNPRAR